MMKTLAVASILAACAVGFAALSQTRTASGEKKEPGKERLFEMRTYTTHPGKLEALHARFREHTNKLFEKHGMTLVGYWTPTEGESAKDTLIYILAYKDNVARDQAWAAFNADPEWVKTRTEMQVSVQVDEKVEQLFLNPTDYSPIK